MIYQEGQVKEKLLDKGSLEQSLREAYGAEGSFFPLVEEGFPSARRILLEGEIHGLERLLEERQRSSAGTSERPALGVESWDRDITWPTSSDSGKGLSEFEQRSPVLIREGTSSTGVRSTVGGGGPPITPPGQGGTPPGLGGDVPPGQGGTPPGQGGGQGGGQGNDK